MGLDNCPFNVGHRMPWRAYRANTSQSFPRVLLGLAWQGDHLPASVQTACQGAPYAGLIRSK